MYPGARVPDEPRRRPTVGGWGFAILLFGLLGGLIGYFATKSDDPRRANHIMKWSLIWSLIAVLVVPVGLVTFGEVVVGDATDDDLGAEASLYGSSGASDESVPASAGSSLVVEGYSDRTETNFVDACREGAIEKGYNFAEARDLCACTYELIADRVPFAEFKEMDVGGDGSVISSFVDECHSSLGIPALD